MNTQTTLPITEARRQLFNIVDEVSKRSSSYTITDKGRPKAVIMSVDEFESWVETLEVRQDFPDLEKDIREVRKDIMTGKYKIYKSLQEVLAEEKYIISDKKNRYDVSNQIQTKRRKRIKAGSKKRK